ncbi:endonuclease/exonuclease/phosphatase family protein [Gordonia sp. VNK1]|uniref:endonuclease/exonuclease/phosphatase family protein n=1 Tax=Gordonia oleivorans TaxID=3156618 RepID=UPI0032B3C26C
MPEFRDPPNRPPDVVWWNVGRSSAATPATRRRLGRQMEFLDSINAQIAIGLTEVSVLARSEWAHWAQSRGFQSITGRSVGGLKTTALLLCRADLIERRSEFSITQSRLSPRGVGGWLELQSARMIHPEVGSIRIAGTYCYGSYQEALKSVRRRQDPRYIVGGDWNLIRSESGRGGPEDWAGTAFDWVHSNTDFTEVVPTRTDGTRGPIDTWHVGARDARQLDHVFADKPTAAQTAVSIVDVNDDTGALSDHRLVTARLGAQ